MTALDKKMLKLKSQLKTFGRVLVAFSGGVDSTFLLKYTRDTLDSSVVALTEDSEVIPRDDFQAAIDFASELLVPHIVVNSSALTDPAFRSNPADRCYHCKRSLYKKMLPLAVEKMAVIVDGTNIDDLKDYRPGLKAAEEFDVRHPLADNGFTKKDIRTASRDMGLATWDKEATPCLATRFAYGIEITGPDIKMIEKAESFIKGFGFKYVRLRLIGDDEAKIEVSPDQVAYLLEIADQIFKGLSDIGLDSISIDRKGYRQGSMNSYIGADL